jgi:hypothetical protein
MPPNVAVEPYTDALVRVRDVVDYFRGMPGTLVTSLEFEHAAAAAAWAALHSGVPFAALCADLGLVAIECLPGNRRAALFIERAMVRFAANVYACPERVHG